MWFLYVVLVVLGGCAGGETPSEAPKEPTVAPAEPAPKERPEGKVIAKVEGGAATLTSTVPLKSGDVSFVSSAVVQSGDNWFLERRTAEGDGCVTERISLHAKAGGLAIVPGLSIKEACKGQNCSLCDFKDSGGCTCKEPVAGDGASLCNHEIFDGESFKGLLETLGPM